ncbi:AMP-binding protein [Leucobacter komagatae]|uniref:AMP-binding protein n=1 Tax=Leucobacter komagatae TaxID=55969 RepID=A0A0D0INF2_9MICO|nr:AMP-binding protein [Leucobacter komagatae]KIP53099.1 AMP-binding protein [Leucobacter komagatae]
MGNGAQISYASGPSTTPLKGQTLGEMLDEITEQYPDKEALVEAFTGRRWTFSELRNESELLAAALTKRGVKKGDRVGIWSPNCAEWVFTQYATAKLGAILVNVNPAYRTHELRYVVEQSGISLMVSAVEYRTSDYAGMLAEIGFSDVLFIGSEGWDAAIADAASNPPNMEVPPLTFDEAINIQYTSGTTGFPKGATLTHHNILNNGFFVGEGLGYTAADRVCLPVPLYHCFGMVMGILGAHSHGSCIVLPAPVFDPAKTLAAVDQERCTSLYGVPTMFIAELALDNFSSFNLDTLRTGIMAGSTCPVEVMEEVIAEMHMSEVAICYGMTETSPVSTMTSTTDGIAARTQTIGRVMPHLEVKIIDEHGQVVPVGEPGELCTRGYSVMLGYWGNSEQTAETIDAGRWIHTGDIATMDSEGRLTVVGRLKDVVIRGGENIYPREIEEFFYRHPDIADVQVIGVPDDRFGEELMAWVMLRPGADSLTAEALREFATGKLAHFKIPKYVHVADSFPMTITGKVRKVEMRELSMAMLDSR